MNSISSPGRLKVQLIVVVLLCVFVGQSYNNARSHSSTWDETHYFGIGKYLLTHFKWDVPGAILHPPLSYYITSIPLLFADTDNSLWATKNGPDVNPGLSNRNVVRGQMTLAAEANTEDVQLIMSRLMVTLLGALLGYYVYRFSSALYGENGGILSLFFFVFSPNMLAFSAIASPDMPLTVFAFISVYYLWLAHTSGERKNFLLSGFFLGLALLSKVPALLFIPVHLILSVSWFVQEKKFEYKNLLLLLCCAILVFISGYGFDLSPYFQGVAYQLNQANQGNDGFLMGECSEHGWWYFYLVALALKTPLPMLLLFIVAIFLSYKRFRSRLPDVMFLVLPILIVLIFFSMAQYTTALRYVLPIFPFMFVMVGSINAYGKRMRYFVCLCAVWYVGTSLYISPHYLTYFNELAGGPGNGYKRMVDGDMGQDLKGLKLYMLENGIEKISLSYFGTDAPQRYGIKYDWLPSFVLYNPEPEKPVQVMQNRFLAISVTNLQGVFLNNREQFRWLLKYEPVAKIGYSIFVYDLNSMNPEK